MNNRIALLAALAALNTTAVIAHDMNAETHTEGFHHHRLNLPQDWVSHNYVTAGFGFGSLNTPNGTANGVAFESSASAQFGPNPLSSGFRGRVSTARFEDGASTSFETTRLSLYLFKPMKINHSAHWVAKLGVQYNYGGNSVAAVSGSTAGESRTNLAGGVALNARMSPRIDYRLSLDYDGTDTTLGGQAILNFGEYQIHGLVAGLSYAGYSSSDVLSVTLGYAFNFSR